MCISCITFYVYMSSHKLYSKDEKRMQYIYLKNEYVNAPKTLITASDNRFVAENREEIQKLYPNVPFEFLRHKNVSGKESCQTFPKREPNIYKNKNFTSIFGITFSNQYWQVYTSKYFTLYLYNAYLDHRESKTFRSAIRIMAFSTRNISVMDQFHWETNRCIIWYDYSEDPKVSDVVIEKTPLGQNAGEYKAYLLTCHIPYSFGKIIPQAVSIIEQGSIRDTCHEPSNYLKVIYNHGTKKDVAVCVKGLSIVEENWSNRFIEWIELLSNLGADKIFFYELGVHPDIKKVLNYYVEKGIVDLTKVTLPGNQPNEMLNQHNYLKGRLLQQRPNSMLHLNDCLYRNINRYKFLAYIDIDEVIVPRDPDHTWIDLLRILSDEYNDADYFKIRSTYFFEDISKYPSLSNTSANGTSNFMYMLRKLYRSKAHLKGKSFIRTKYVKTVNCHIARECLNRRCKFQDVDVEAAHVHHYRKSCQRMVEDDTCLRYKQNLVFDNTLLKFQEKLYSKM